MGSVSRVIKNFLTEQELMGLLVRYSDLVAIAGYPECRRVFVSYRVGTGEK
jgi:hypothetical protein